MTDTTPSLPSLPRYRALCSDCTQAVRATEVHVVPDGVAAYCTRCAPTWRPYAHRILSIADAWRERLTVTL